MSDTQKVLDTENQQINMKIEEWSDMKCLWIASRDKFPAAVKDISIQKNIISRYLNFYLSGKVQKGLTARDLAFAVISIMPISSQSEEFIWPDTEYSEKGNLFFLTPDDRLKYDINSVIGKRPEEEENARPNDVQETSRNEENSGKSTKAPFSLEKTNICSHLKNVTTTEDNNKINHEDDDHNESEIHVDHENEDQGNEGHENEVGNENLGNEDQGNDTSNIPNDLEWFRLKQDVTSETSPTKEIKYGPVENAAFCIYCNKILDNWETNVSGRIILKYFFAMSALLVMRGKTKTFQNITKYFSTKFVSSLYPHVPECYTTPHRGFVKKCWKAFRESDEKIRVMFAKLVVISLLQPERVNHFGKKNVIRFAVLSHTVYTGMGIVHLLQQLAAIVTNNFKTLFKFLYSKETAASWYRVNGFFKKYLSKQKKQHTFHWAGVIDGEDGESFKYLSCNNNYELAVVIAVFIEKLTGNAGVWKSAWVSKGVSVEDCKLLGCRLYEEYKKYEESKWRNLKKIRLEHILEMFGDLGSMDSEIDKIINDYNLS